MVKLKTLRNKICNKQSPSELVSVLFTFMLLKIIMKHDSLNSKIKKFKITANKTHVKSVDKLKTLFLSVRRQKPNNDYLYQCSEMTSQSTNKTA